LQEKVERSFSDIRIETYLEAVKSRLTEIVEGECPKWGECEWRDADGVRYNFWADEPSEYYVTDKSVRADEFAGRAIRALGIGTARDRQQVLAAARTFLAGAELTCDWSDYVPQEVCQAFLGPGNVTIIFDASGRLSEVDFTAYHYT
jgi:hypothetical protein